MDQGSLVIEKRESGERLIKELETQGFETRLAFWLKPTEDGKWFLYIASPMVDEKGGAEAFRFIYRILRTSPDMWIEPLDIRAIGVNDSLTTAALLAKMPAIPNHPFANPNAKPYPGGTQLGAGTFGGMDIDGAYIYPLSQPTA